MPIKQHWYGMDKRERDRAYHVMVKQGRRVKRILLANQDTWEPGMGSFGVGMTSRKGYKHGTVYGIMEY